MSSLHAVTIALLLTAVLVLLAVSDGPYSIVRSGQETSAATPLPIGTAEASFLVRESGGMLVWDAVSGADLYEVSGNVSGVSYTIDGNCAEDIVEDWNEQFSGSTEQTSFPLPTPQTPPPVGERWAITSLDAQVVALDEGGDAVASGSFGAIGEANVCSNPTPVAPTRIAEDFSPTPTPVARRGGSELLPPETGHGPDSY